VGLTALKAHQTSRPRASTSGRNAWLSHQMLSNVIILLLAKAKIHASFFCPDHRYINIFLDTAVANPIKAKPVTTDSCHLAWWTKWRTRISMFSCSSKRLWDNLRRPIKTKQQAMVSQPASCYTCQPYYVAASVATLSAACTDPVVRPRHTAKVSIQ